MIDLDETINAVTEDIRTNPCFWSYQESGRNIKSVTKVLVEKFNLELTDLMADLDNLRSQIESLKEELKKKESFGELDEKIC